MEPQLSTALGEGATIVTATRHLSRALIRQYDLKQKQEGMTAWESADILPWDAWINRCWLAIEPTLLNPPVVLSDPQLESVWTELIEQDIDHHASDSAPLWSTRAAARAAIRSLTLVRQWDIDIRQTNFSSHDDHRCFVRWLRTFENICKEKNWIEFSNLARLLIAHVDEMNLARIVLVGFDRVLPLQCALIHAVEQAGVKVTNLAPRGFIDPVRVHAEFENDLSQWMAAGQWARKKLEAEPDCRIALVAPDLARSRDNIEYALRQTLCPRDIVDIGDRASLPFHISLGTSLGDQQIIRSALHLLGTLSHHNVSVDLISELILSPHVHGSDQERVERGKLDLKLRQKLPLLANLRPVSELLALENNYGGEESCPVLADVLATTHQLVTQFPARSTYSNWSWYFDRALSVLGWPGTVNLDSENFQAVKALREQFSRLAELDLTANKIGYDAALNWLRHRLETEIFQVEETQTQVEILDVFESAGLDFDYLWFGGLVEADWPPRLNIDPFIPISVQREFGIESASVPGALDLAKLQQKRMFASAREIVVSRHRYESDIALAPSPLINFPTPCEKISIEVPPKIDQLVNLQRPEQELVEDSLGPALDSDEIVLGGTSLIQTQSLCPRGAFARYRLGAEPTLDNQFGLDQFERGALVHRVLELVWQSLENSKELRAIPSVKLEKLIAKCADRASRRYRSASGCGEHFFLSVQRWIVSTVSEWLELERMRAQSFEVISLEEPTNLELAGLDLQFKIDRIDKLEDGSLILIDYKTGASNSIFDWMEDRPFSPQLPLYALSQSNTIEAISWGQVRLGQCRFIGLSNRYEFAKDGADGINVKIFERQLDFVEQFGTWEGMLQHWTRTLESIAMEYVSGDARYDPRNHGVCTSCPTPVICRNGDRFILDQN